MGGWRSREVQVHRPEGYIASFPGLFTRFVALGETEAVAERIPDLQHAMVAGTRFDAGLRSILCKFPMQVVEARNAHVHRSARRRITAMLAEMKNQLRPRNLSIQGEVRSEPMLPIQRETELSNVEGLGLVDVENADDRNSRFEMNFARLGRADSLAPPS